MNHLSILSDYLAILDREGISHVCINSGPSYIRIETAWYIPADELRSFKSLFGPFKAKGTAPWIELSSTFDHDLPDGKVFRATFAITDAFKCEVTKTKTVVEPLSERELERRRAEIERLQAELESGTTSKEVHSYSCHPAPRRHRNS